MRGVTPALVLRLTFGEAFSRAEMSSGRPHLAAQCSGAFVFSSTASTSAPSLRALRSASWSPISAAFCRSPSALTFFTLGLG